MKRSLHVVALCGAIWLNAHCASRVVYAPTAPPTFRAEVTGPPPSAGMVWISGHWEWQGRWVWSPGHWARSPKGKVWVPGHWQHTARGWRWVQGHWGAR